MNIVYEKVGETRGRPTKFVVLDDGTKIKFTEWKASQPKGKRGRKAFERDEAGNIIRPEPITLVLEEVEPPFPVSYVFEEPADYDIEPMENRKFEFFKGLDIDTENGTEEEVLEKCNDILSQPDMSDDEFSAFLSEVKQEMKVKNRHLAELKKSA